jgi:hypothetical protein
VTDLPVEPWTDADTFGPAAEALRIVRERGPMTRQVRESVLREGGAEAWEALLASVSLACRARFFKVPGYFEWVESPLALELHAAWTALRGADPMAERGKDAAREILGGAHRWMLKLATPGLLLQAFPRLYDFYYQGGLVTVERLDESSAELILDAWGYPEAWYRDALTAWLLAALEATGTPNISLAYQAPRPGTCRHRYSVRWG